jgi:hypothetical protein
MKYKFFAIALLLFATSCTAQTDRGVHLRLYRDWGYAGFEHDIEGWFSMAAEAPSDTDRVEFYVGNELVYADDQAPYRARFHTRDYAPGERTLYALAIAGNGTATRSNEYTRDLLTSAEAWRRITDLTGPIALLIAFFFALAILAQLWPRKKPQLGKYGIGGVGVCPKCGLPAPIRLFSFHAGFNNLEKCPHCEKWIWVRRARPEDLRAAEDRWRKQAAG